jgi:VWFA-related protein
MNANKHLLAIVLALVAIPSRAQDSALGSFGEVLDVRVVNVEVVVEDRAGVRVSGLAPSDFRLTVDGKEVSIEYFTEVRGGEAMEMAAGAATARVPTLEPGGAVGTSYLVFIDDFFALERDRDRVLDRMVADLPNLGPADRMAIVAFDGKKLEMISSWSQSVPALERSLKQAMDRPAYGLHRLTERRSADRDLQIARQTRGGFDARSIMARPDLSVRDYAERLSDHVERSVDAAAATLRSFAAPPGRKVMLLLSGGWPYQPLQYAIDQDRIALPERDIPEGPDLFEPLVGTANLLGYTLYPVDVPGLIGETIDAATSDPGETGFAAFTSQQREQETQASLTYLARETGGRALINSRRGEVFSTVAQDTRSYYWLGFTPERKGDDRSHRIEVDVRRPGLKVRTREGFQDFSRQREVTMSVESALLFGNPPSSKPLDVAVGRPVKEGMRTVHVPIRLQIPTDRITLVPVGQKRVAELELRVAALDEEGRRSEIPVIPVRIEASADARPGGVLPYEATVELRKAKQSVVISLYDVASGDMFSTTREVDP